MFVRLWMTENPSTITTTTSVEKARSRMKEISARRLPVVNKENELVGIVSTTDIYNALPSFVDGSSAGSAVAFSESTTVGEIMTPDPMSVGPMTPLELVAKRMRQHKVGAMPVLSNGELVGIITESDIFRAFMELFGANEEGVRVEIIMGKDSEAFYDLFAVLRRHGVLIIAISIHHNYGKNQRLITMKIDGEELEYALNATRKLGVQINFIQDEGEDF